VGAPGHLDALGHPDADRLPLPGARVGSGAVRTKSPSTITSAGPASRACGEVFVTRTVPKTAVSTDGTHT